MIHDIFLSRYRGELFYGDSPTPEMHQFFMQTAHIIFDDLVPRLRVDQMLFKRAHDALAREAGVGRLREGTTWDAICGSFLVERYDLWNDDHGSPSLFLRMRLSLVELLFREFAHVAATLNRDRGAGEAIAEAVRELNLRLRNAKFGLHYHNGILQFARDGLTEERTAEPCWSLLRDSKWKSVDRELKEAIDRADAGKSDACFHAGKALESTVKIISDERGWSTGRERGAANYIDNLVSEANGRFLAPWEGDMLKEYFRNLRNPHGHGAGSQPPPLLTPDQIAWAIEVAMAWIKNLVRRS